MYRGLGAGGDSPLEGRSFGKYALRKRVHSLPAAPDEIRMEGGKNGLRTPFYI